MGRRPPGPTRSPSLPRRPAGHARPGPGPASVPATVGHDNRDLAAIIMSPARAAPPPAAAAAGPAPASGPGRQPTGPQATTVGVAVTVAAPAHICGNDHRDGASGLPSDSDSESESVALALAPGPASDAPRQPWAGPPARPGSRAESRVPDSYRPRWRRTRPRPPRPGARWAVTVPVTVTSAGSRVNLST